jgi:hypothetical protein
MPDEGGDQGIVVHRLESPLGFLSPLITQLTGYPGLKSRATRGVFARPFDVVHFHNISLVGGPALIAQSRAPVNLYTTHDHWLLCPTHAFWKNKSKPCDRPTCFSCSLQSGIPPQLWRYTRLVERSTARLDAMLATSEYTARQYRSRGLEPPIHVLPSFRRIGRKLHPVEFLGQSVSFAPGAVKLAQLVGAPLLPMFWIPAVDSPAVLEIDPQIIPDPARDDDAEVVDCLQQFADALAARIMRWPEAYRNWHMVGGEAVD